MTGVPETVTPGVVHAAKALAEAIQGSPVWKAWEQACARFDSDPELRRAVERLQQLSMRFRQARAQGKGFFGPEVAEMNKLQMQIQQSPLAQKRDEAAQALLSLLQATNRILSDALGIDFAANAAARGGGCCG
ncbi:MAG: YlbF family regulator [Thermoanaerobaculum sp.]